MSFPENRGLPYYQLEMHLLRLRHGNIGKATRVASVLPRKVTVHCMEVAGAALLMMPCPENASTTRFWVYRGILMRFAPSTTVGRGLNPLLECFQVRTSSPNACI